jgi:hypothetical protein
LAREKLAKVAGIVAGHPGLKLDVEGHTDNVGGDAYNQTLSESVVAPYATTARWNGVKLCHIQRSAKRSRSLRMTTPPAVSRIAVELVISGNVIGTEIGTPIAQVVIVRFKPPRYLPGIAAASLLHEPTQE